MGLKHTRGLPTMNDDPWDYPIKGELSKWNKEKNITYKAG